MIVLAWRGENNHHGALNLYPIFIPRFEGEVSGVRTERDFRFQGSVRRVPQNGQSNRKRNYLLMHSVIIDCGSGLLT